MDVVVETFQPMGPQIISHGLSTIDILNENTGICSPATSSITRTPNTTHGRASEYVVRKLTVVVSSVGDYREENYKTYFEIAHANFKLQSERKNI